MLRPYHARVRARARAPRRHGREVHRRRGDGALRRAGRARGRSRASGARGARDSRLRGRGRRSSCRVGITTGEALVSLDASPAEGEGMASGDVVNTAARLQSAAPVNGVLADETTYRATRQAIEYGEADGRRGEGQVRADPRLAGASGTRAIRGGRRPRGAHRSSSGASASSPSCGTRSSRARHSRTSQLVTLVGVPGIGKSRLVYELSRRSSTPIPSSSPGARVAASPTGTESRSGRSGRS